MVLNVKYVIISLTHKLTLLVKGRGQQNIYDMLSCLSWTQTLSSPRSLGILGKKKSKIIGSKSKWKGDDKRAWRMIGGRGCMYIWL